MHFSSKSFNLITIAFMALLPVCLGTGCSAGDEEPSVMQGVIEGAIESGGYPQVLFTRTIVPDREGTLSDALINWGRISIFDGEDEVVLTGRVDADRIPPFRYYTFDMVGTPGKTYTIRADYEDIHLSATCRMPFPTSIDSVTLQPAGKDSLRGATLHFTSPTDTPSYYYITMVDSGKSPLLPPPAFMCTICADKPNTAYSIPIIRPRQKLDTTDYVAQLRVGEVWVVALNRVTKEVYDFWTAYDNMLLTANSPFLSGDTNLPTNIVSGHGVWSAQGSDRHRFTVK